MNKFFVFLFGFSVIGLIASLIWLLDILTVRSTEQTSCDIRCFEEGASSSETVWSSTDENYRCFCILTGVPTWESNAEEDDNERTENPNDIQQ